MRWHPRSSLRALLLFSFLGALIGAGAVVALTGADAYERTDSLIGTSAMGMLGGFAYGLLSITVRRASAARRS
ncbi:hypothetical protein [Luteipulveratus halotolerans]|uniref:Uncharacterized protein n=1 Tax=Luteipulveratus halotolerans TaxID=1631356 RepID=A0A0L6CJI1_9MICO|nr:hypothetical protein [Luteipulveratus halotolerans]KNX37936.1 hypothetical protein VV01_13495 [Luteipulveratus halotolerans]